MHSFSSIAASLIIQMMNRTGARVWEMESELLQQFTDAAVQMAAQITEAEMALPDSFKVVAVDSLNFADFAGDFSPAAANDHRHGASQTNTQLAVASVANNAAAQSSKMDLGENRWEMYHVTAAFELASTPTSLAPIDIWWAPSPSATAGVANPGGASGVAGAYTGYSSNPTTAIEQCQFIGSFICTVQTTPIVQQDLDVGILVPQQRYGSLIILNKSGAAFHSDDVECHVCFHGFGRQIQE